jgi:hypothetical protein
MRMRRKKIKAIAHPVLAPSKAGETCSAIPGVAPMPMPIAMNSRIVTAASLARSYMSYAAGLAADRRQFTVGVIDKFDTTSSSAARLDHAQVPGMKAAAPATPISRRTVVR